jgi:hypothetical protein
MLRARVTRAGRTIVRRLAMNDVVEKIHNTS